MPIAREQFKRYVETINAINNPPFPSEVTGMRESNRKLEYIILKVKKEREKYKYERRKL
jgi:hypothetical protein